MIPDLSIIIVSYNSKKLTLDCLKSIYSQKWDLTYETWVVDNNSSDGSVEAIKRKYPKVHLLENKKNLGFGSANNIVLKRSKSKYCLLLNSDTNLLKNSLDNLVKFSNQNSFAITSCKLIYPNGEFQPNAGDLPGFFPTFFWLSNLDNILNNFFIFPSLHQNNLNYYNKNKEVGWVAGTVMLVKKEVTSKIGFFDSKIFMYGEDIDFCWRAKKAGFKIGWTNEATVVHVGGGSSKKPRFNQWMGEFTSLLYLYNKYYGKVASYFLRLLIYKFVLLRILIFAITGKFSYSKTYAKVIVNI